jgi:hypothetical protein
VQDLLIALIDGRTGFPEAITAVFPQTQIHTWRYATSSCGGGAAPEWKAALPHFVVLFGDRFVPET